METLSPITPQQQVVTPPLAFRRTESARLGPGQPESSGDML